MLRPPSKGSLLREALPEERIAAAGALRSSESTGSLHLQPLSGGSAFPVRPVAKAVPKGSKDQKLLKIDCDRLGIVGLDATSRLLELLPLKRPDASKAKPDSIHFKCSHLVRTITPATITPTFPAREPGDKRVRTADRLRAGEALVRAFVRHVGANDALYSLEVTHAPLRLFDWQHLGMSLRNNGCPLVYLSLAGSRLGDAGLAAFGPALLAHQETLREINLDGCGLTSGASAWLIRLLQVSNLRQNEGRRRKELTTWSGALRGRDKRRRGQRRTNQRAFDNEYAEPADEDRREALVGIHTLSIAGNDLGDEGGFALANHLMQDDWLTEIDLRRNGIGHAALAALREAVGMRETSETERLLVVPALLCRLDGNAEERDRIKRLLQQQKQREEQLRKQQPQRPHSARAALSSSSSSGAFGCSSATPLELEARRMRSALQRKRQVASATADALEQVHRGARAASSTADAPPAVQLSAEDWDGLVKVSGGPTALLDAMEGLLAAALQKAF